MKKTPGYKLVTPSERRRLRRELKQMWSTVPLHALDRARELAEVQAGKGHEFRIAAVKEQEGTQFIDYRVGINLRLGLVDDVVKGKKAKLLKVQLQCGERAWQINDGIYAKRFRSSEQLTDWLASIEKHLRVHLSERLLDTCFLTWDEAVAKASSEHGVRNVDLTALAKAHLKDLRHDKSKSLSIPRGRRRGSKQSKVYLSKKQVQIDLPKFIRVNGEETTRKEAAGWFGLSNEKAFDRAVRRYDKRGWRRLKADAMMETKKGH